MNEIMNISGVSCYEENGTAYLRLEDVARGLGFTQMKNGIEYVKWERVNSYLIDLGFSPEVGKDGYIPENIFYRIAMKAKNETAEKFQALVADEIIPSIRKHGAYMTSDTLEKALTSPDFLIQLATNLKEEQQKRIAAESKMQEMKPHAILGRAITTAKTSILVGDLAKIIAQNGVQIGQRRLFEWLRNNGYLIRQKGASWNMPTQRSMDMGLFEIKESVHIDGNGCNKITRTTTVTGKGQEFFVNKFLG